MDNKVITGAAVFIAIVCLLPMAGVLVAAIVGSLDTLIQLMETVIWRYTSTTLVLVALVATGSILIGASSAWLVVTTEFPGRKILEVALVLPLAFPAYVL
ncbi:MAG: iron ABC transporter permease, partial [Roseobacter sp.]